MDAHDKVYKYSIRYSRDISIISSGEFNVAIVNDEPTSRILLLKYHDTDPLDTMRDHLIFVSKKHKFPSKRYNKYADFILSVFRQHRYLFEENTNSTIDPNSIRIILPDSMLQVREFENSNTYSVNIYSYKYKFKNESIYEYEFNSGLRYYMLTNYIDSILAVENKETDDIDILAYKPIRSCNRLMLSIIDKHGVYTDMIKIDNDTYKSIMKRCIDKFKKCKGDNNITQEDL